MGSWIAIIVATVVQFILGFVWYGLLFGKVWGKMHGFDKLSKETQDKMMKQMGPVYGVQFVFTFITSFVFSLFITNLPGNWNPYGMAFFFWLGFVLPTQAGAAMFGGAPEGWTIKKIAIQSSYSLIALLATAFVLVNLAGF